MNIQMKSAQSGFTLIELVVVIVILGILAATALPKFIDLTGNADQAATSGVAGALTSAASIDYGAYLVSNANAAPISSGNVCAATMANALVTGTTFSPTGTTLLQGQYTIAGNTACTAGQTVACTLTSYKSNTATANVVCTN